MSPVRVGGLTVDSWWALLSAEIACCRIRLPQPSGKLISLGVLAVAFQNPHDGHYGVPIPRGRRHTKQSIDLAKIANRFHVPPILSEDEAIF